jgi:hypothetical protein
VNSQIKDKLCPIDPLRYQDDTLFYLFHMYTNDIVQFQTAAVLYDRDWRYHTERKVWLTKVPGVEPLQKTNTYEKGVYTVFDPSLWRKVQADMTIEYCKLAEKPMIPAPLLQQQQQQHHMQQQQHMNMLPGGMHAHIQSFPSLGAMGGNQGAPLSSTTLTPAAKNNPGMANNGSASSLKFFFA